jgi:hypothetical protein
VRFVDGLPRNEQFAVTVEPAVGSAQPTSDIVAQVSLI